MVKTMNRQAGIEGSKRYLADLRGFFFGCGLCGVGGVLKNFMAMSSIVIGFASRFSFSARMVGV